MRAVENRGESGQVVVLLVILLAMAGGAWWYGSNARTRKEQEARAFANEVAQRVILQGDTRFLDGALSPDARTHYPPSWRERMFEKIRNQGAPLSGIEMTGDVRFANWFLDPSGEFRANVQYANGPATLHIIVSHPAFVWQIDDLNYLWARPPEAPPVLPTPTPTITPHDQK